MSHDAVRDAHRTVDEAIRHLFEYGRGPDGEKVRPTCRRGCPSCCYEPVYAERAEVLLVAQRLLRLDPEARARVVARAREWLARFRGSALAREESPDVVAYRRMRLACPLLEGGECVVYEDRPAACRAHVALGPVELCEDDARRPGQAFMANNDFMVGVVMKMAAGLAREGRADLLMEHLGLLLAEALTGERVESEARRVLPVVFEDDDGAGGGAGGG